MLKGEFFSKFVKNAKLLNGEDENITDYRDMVKVLVDGYVERVKIADAPMIYGFDEKYSVENMYPNITKRWSSINQQKPSEIFYKSDMVIFLKTSNGDVPFNLLDTESELINDAEQVQRKEYNFKTLSKFEALVESSGTSTFVSELTARYIGLVTHFSDISEDDLKDIDEDIILSFSSGELKDFLSSWKIKSFSKSSYIVSTYNLTFNLLDLDLVVGVDYFNISGDRTEYVKKNELLRYCDMFDNVQLAYILYGTFLGFGENQFEILRGLKMENIDKDKKVVIWDGVEYPIDDSFISLAEECNSITSYTEIAMKSSTIPKEHPLNPASEYILKPRMQSNNNNGLEQMASISVRTAIARASEYLFGDRKFNKTYLHRSGILHQMNIIEKETGVEWSTYLINSKDNGLMFKFNIRDMMNAYKINYKS